MNQNDPFKNFYRQKKQRQRQRQYRSKYSKPHRTCISENSRNHKTNLNKYVPPHRQCQSIQSIHSIQSIQSIQHTDKNKPYNKDVYQTDFGFRSRYKNLTIPSNEEYKNFNNGKNPLKSNHVRCGVIAFNKAFTKTLCVLNKYVWDERGVRLWGLPKGHLEKIEGKKQDTSNTNTPDTPDTPDTPKYENYIDCAEREFLEETGIKIKLKRNVHIMIRINNTMYFPIIIKDTTPIKPIDNIEIMDVEWKNLEELKKEGLKTVNQNQDLKVFLQRFQGRCKKLAKNAY